MPADNKKGLYDNIDSHSRIMPNAKNRLNILFLMQIMRKLVGILIAVA